MRASAAIFDYRQATSADAPAMTRCRAADTEAGPADARIASYLDGKHHPQQALADRVAFIALTAGGVVYTALGARPLNPHWYVWDDIDVLLRPDA